MQSPLTVRLVLFDLDGTLVHSAPDLVDSANAMLRALGRAEQPPERVIGWIGNGMARLVKRALTGEMEAEPDPALFERGFEAFKAHYARNLTTRTRPFPGVVEMLERLRVRGFRLGCVTNKAEAFTRPLLEQLGLLPYFAVVVGGDTVAARKPDPRPLAHAAAEAGVAPGHTAMVGDSVNDFLAARAAGMGVIAVTWGYHRGRDVRDCAPDVVVDSAGEVPQYLRLPSETP
jgi:phosphoglycolate phosphatase